MGDLGPWLANLTKVESVSGTLNSGESLTISGSDAETNRLIVTEIIHGDDCTVTVEFDTTGNGSFDKSVEVDTLSSNGISQGNQIKLDGVEMQVKIENTGTTADFIIMGEGAA